MLSECFKRNESAKTLQRLISNRARPAQAGRSQVQSRLIDNWDYKDGDSGLNGKSLVQGMPIDVRLVDWDCLQGDCHQEA